MIPLDTDAAAGWVWLGLLHSAWLGLAVAAVVAWIFQIRPNLAPTTRQTILVLALATVALGPVVLTTLQHQAPGWAVTQGWQGEVSIQLLNDRGPRAGLSPADAPTPLQVESTDPSRWFRTLAVQSVAFAKATRPFGLAAWLVVVAAGFSTLALGSCGVRRLCRESFPASDPIGDRAFTLADRLGMNRVPVVRVHPGLVEPGLYGVVRPVILLPGRWLATARPEAIDAVLAHELAHARRRDALGHTTLRWLEAVSGFHPGVVWLSRSLRRQRELLADSLAVQLTGNPLALARALESVARLRLLSRPTRPLGIAFGGEPASLLPRIQELLGMMPTPPRPSAWPFAAFPLALTLALVTVSLGFSQDPPAVPPTPQAPAIPLPAPAPPPRPKREPEPTQFSFEIRSLVYPSGSWRTDLPGRVVPVDTRQDLPPRWLLDPNALRELVTRMSQEAAASSTQAPKVTTLEAQNAIIQFSGDAGRPGPQPEGFLLRVDVTGHKIPGGCQVEYDLRTRTEDTTAKANPSSRESIARGTCVIPEGESLVVDMGPNQPEPGSAKKPTDRLVVITCRRIITEAEEDRMVQPIRLRHPEPVPAPSIAVPFW